MNIATGLGNIMLVMGYALMLNVHPLFAIMKIVGSSLLIYYYSKERKLDVVTTLSIFTAIDIKFLINTL